MPHSISAVKVIFNPSSLPVHLPAIFGTLTTTIFTLTPVCVCAFVCAVCLDTSWSMAGPRENLAKAVVLECSKQGREWLLL